MSDISNIKIDFHVDDTKKYFYNKGIIKKKKSIHWILEKYNNNFSTEIKPF